MLDTDGVARTLHFSDELFDAQFVRALAYAPQGGADLGECLEIASRITKVDSRRWYDEWRAGAERVERAAEAHAAAGDMAKARGAWLRASNYHRTSGLFVMGPDPAYRDTVRRQTAAFRKAAELFDHPVEAIEIPYESTTLPGYVFRVAPHSSGTRRPLLIATDGYDGTIEELYFAIALPALERGYDVLAYDGPGQGSVISEQGLPFRADWENVVTPVVDHALTLDGVDPERIVLAGWSFGGYLAPRAATAEHRLAACVSDSGPYDLRAALLDRIPGPLASRFDGGNAMAVGLLRRIMGARVSSTTAGWALRRAVYVHDLQHPIDYLETARDYTLRGIADRITCPTFVCTTEGDDVSARAGELASEVTCPHEYVEFRNVDGVSGHCEMTGRAQFHQKAFDWLDEVLGRG